MNLRLASVRSRIAAALMAAALVVAAASAASRAAAQGAAGDDEALFKKAAAALGAGEYGAAIDALETLADRGFLHPDASYDRGLAYLMRIRARAERPGDLGRAAAAFEETLRLRPDDAEADAALDLVRGEVTRRRSRKGGSTVDVRPTLDRVIAGLVSDRAWTVAALIASCLLAIGLVLRRFERPGGGLRAADAAAPAIKPASGPAHPLHVAGSVLVATGVVALLVLAPIAWHSRVLRLTTRPGVIIATEAHFTDENGRAAGGDAIPEAAAVEVGERRGGILRVRWGAEEGWLPAASVRVLP